MYHADDYTRQAIESTGFDLGETFKSEAEVRAYFTRENMIAMFGPQDGAVPQASLDKMADTVIANGWHCEFAAA